MIDTRSFPHCCTATVLVNFGESFTAAGGAHNLSYEEGKAEVEELIRNYRQAGFAFLIAVLNNEQVTGRKILENLGFYRSEEMSKPAHRNTTVTIWWLPLHEEE